MEKEQPAVYHSESLNRNRDQMASGDTESAVAAELWFIATRRMIEGLLIFL